MKKITLLLLVLLLSVTHICFAKINIDRVSLSGISYGDSVSKVLNVYGMPQNASAGEFIFKDKTQPIVVLQYKDGLIVAVLKKSETIFDIMSSSPMIKTRDGISAGMSINRVYSTYGKPDFTRKYKGRTLSAYRAVAHNGDVVVLEFDDENGFIKQIEIHIDDGKDEDFEVKK